jgi:hypothetical protein
MDRNPLRPRLELLEDRCLLSSGAPGDVVAMWANAYSYYGRPVFNLPQSVGRVVEPTGVQDVNATLDSSVPLSAFDTKVEGNGDVIFSARFNPTQLYRFDPGTGKATVIHDLSGQGLSLVSWTTAPYDSVLDIWSNGVTSVLSRVNEATGQATALYSSTTVKPTAAAGEANNDVIFGTGAQIYRIDAAGNATLLYDLTARQNTTLAGWSLAPDGSIVAAWSQSNPDGSFNNAGVDRINEATGQATSLLANSNIALSSPAGEANGDVVLQSGNVLYRLSAGQLSVLHDLQSQGLTLSHWSLAPDGSVVDSWYSINSPDGIHSFPSTPAGVSRINEATGQEVLHYSASVVPYQAAAEANGDIVFVSDQAIYRLAAGASQPTAILTLSGSQVFGQTLALQPQEQLPYTISGSTLTVTGTVASDTFTCDAAHRFASFNGDVFAIPSGVTAVQFFGGGGSDVAVLGAGPTGYTLGAGPGYAILSGGGLTVSASGVSAVTAYGGAGDTAFLSDTLGGAAFVGQPTYAYLQGKGFVNTTVGFGAVASFAPSGGGGDVAYLVDNLGNAVLYGSSSYSEMVGQGFNNYAVGFKTVVGYGSGANDIAVLYGAAQGGNTFVGTNSYAGMFGANSSFQAYAVGFRSVYGNAGGGGDAAYLYGSMTASDGVSQSGSTAEVFGASFFDDAIGFAYDYLNPSAHRF